MEEAKSVTVAKLYGLRAGLSLISESADEIIGIDNIMGELESMKAECDESLKTIDENLSAKERGIGIKTAAKQAKEKELSELGSEQDYVNNSIDENAFKARYKSVWSWWYVLIFFIVGLLLCPSFILSMIGSTGFVKTLMISLIFIVPTFVIAVIWNIRYIAAKGDMKRAKKKHIEDKKHNYGWEVERITKQIVAIEKDISELTAKRDEWLQMKNTAVTQSENLVSTINEQSPEFNEKISCLRGFALGVEAMLKNEYSALISPADWRNVDLIIFYLSTGRADSIKEALQQVDSQRRTEAIVQEIKFANENICREIHGGFVALGGAVIQCFSVLGEKLNSAVGSISSEIKNLSDGVSARNEIFNKGVSSVELNNALQEKANTTSEKLLEHLEYIREHAESV